MFDSLSDETNSFQRLIIKKQKQKYANKDCVTIINFRTIIFLCCRSVFQIYFAPITLTHSWPTKSWTEFNISQWQKKYWKNLFVNTKTIVQKFIV